MSVSYNKLYTYIYKNNTNTTLAKYEVIYNNNSILRLHKLSHFRHDQRTSVQLDIVLVHRCFLCYQHDIINYVFWKGIQLPKILFFNAKQKNGIRTGVSTAFIQVSKINAHVKNKNGLHTKNKIQKRYWLTKNRKLMTNRMYFIHVFPQLNSAILSLFYLK